MSHGRPRLTRLQEPRLRTNGSQSPHVLFSRRYDKIFLPIHMGASRCGTCILLLPMRLCFVRRHFSVFPFDISQRLLSQLKTRIWAVDTVHFLAFLTFLSLSTSSCVAYCQNGCKLAISRLRIAKLIIERD